MSPSLSHLNWLWNLCDICSAHVAPLKFHLTGISPQLFLPIPSSGMCLCPKGAAPAPPSPLGRKTSEFCPLQPKIKSSTKPWEPEHPCPAPFPLKLLFSSLEWTGKRNCSTPPIKTWSLPTAGLSFTAQNYGHTLGIGISLLCSLLVPRALPLPPSPGFNLRKMN